MRKIQRKCPSVNQSSKVGKREYGPFGNSFYSPFVLVVSIYQARKLQFSCETEKKFAIFPTMYYRESNRFYTECFKSKGHKNFLLSSKNKNSCDTLRKSTTGK